MRTPPNKPNLSMGLLYGLAAGIAFAFFAWGLDAIALARAHAAFPWVKFLPGLLICALTGAVVGWATMRFQKAWLTIPLWLAMAYLFVRLTIWLPIHISPFLIRLLDKELGSYLVYPSYPEFEQYFVFGFIATAIAAVICGLIENVLIEQSRFSSGTAAAIIPLVICFLSFSLVGNSTDTMLNSFMRKPVRVVDNLLQFSLDNADKEVPKDVARTMHLAALNTIKDIVQNDRRLIIQTYDQSLYQMNVLMDFEGKWAECLTVFDQVTICKPIVESP